MTYKSPQAALIVPKNPESLPFRTGGVVKVATEENPFMKIVKQAAENGVKELRSCSETNRSPGSEHAWNRLAETHGAVKESGTWRVKTGDILPIPLKGLQACH